MTTTEITLTLSSLEFHENTARTLIVPKGVLLVNGSQVDCNEGNMREFLIDLMSLNSNSCHQTPYLSSSGSAWVQSEDQTIWLMVSMNESSHEIKSHQLSLYPDRALEQCYHPRFGQKLYKVNSTLWLSLERRGIPLEMIDLIFASD